MRKRAGKARVWVNVSALALGVVNEAEGCIIEEASWLCKDDFSHINMAELLERLNFVLAREIKEVELLTNFSMFFSMDLTQTLWK